VSDHIFDWAWSGDADDVEGDESEMPYPDWLEQRPEYEGDRYEPAIEEEEEE
jgi:hypothetical protein